MDTMYRDHLYTIALLKCRSGILDGASFSELWYALSAARRCLMSAALPWKYVLKYALPMQSARFPSCQNQQSSTWMLDGNSACIPMRCYREPRHFLAKLSSHLARLRLEKWHEPTISAHRCGWGAASRSAVRVHPTPPSPASLLGDQGEGGGHTYTKSPAR
jgi:hypothetical protein